MSGHSKWSQIKRQKGAADARRGAAFTKAANAITIAAREGGNNPEANFKLRLVIEAAKRLNMPKENIERAIARGTGAGKGATTLENITYEGYGPAGVAIVVEAVTDNRLRTAQEVRSVFERGGGTLAGPGSVAHIFLPVGEITVHHPENLDADQILLIAAEAGAEDIETNVDEAVVYCQPADLEKVRQRLATAGLEVVEAHLSRKPTSVIKIGEETKAAAILSLTNKLEELPDVQKVYANFDIPEGVLERQAEIAK